MKQKCVLDRKIEQIDQWIELYAQKLYNRASYLLNNPSDAQDIVQDVFLIAHEKRTTFQGNSTPLTWLMSILHNKVSDWYRQKYKKGIQVDLDSFFDHDNFWRDHEGVLLDWTFYEQMENETFEEYLDRCMEKLPARWLILVKLTYLQEKKSQDICQEMNISKTNYWKMLQRSRLQLRECLEENKK